MNFIFTSLTSSAAVSWATDSLENFPFIGVSSIHLQTMRLYSLVFTFLFGEMRGLCGTLTQRESRLLMCGISQERVKSFSFTPTQSPALRHEVALPAATRGGGQC